MQNECSKIKNCVKINRRHPEKLSIGTVVFIIKYGKFIRQSKNIVFVVDHYEI